MAKLSCLFNRVVQLRKLIKEYDAVGVCGAEDNRETNTIPPPKYLHEDLNIFTHFQDDSQFEKSF